MNGSRCLLLKSLKQLLVAKNILISKIGRLILNTKAISQLVRSYLASGRSWALTTKSNLQEYYSFVQVHRDFLWEGSKHWKVIEVSGQSFVFKRLIITSSEEG